MRDRWKLEEQRKRGKIRKEVEKGEDERVKVWREVKGKA